MHLNALLPLAALAAAMPQPNTHQIRSSSGCSKPLSPSTPAGGATTNHTITSGGRTRSYLLHIPSDYSPDTPTPLILSFHGNSRTASYQESLSQFSDPHFNPSWLAVYPQGLGNSWQGPSYATPGVSDTRFIADLLDHLEAELCVDTTRVYATGKSNGGGFTGTLACDGEVAGPRIAAFAPVSGAFYDFGEDGSGCHPGRKGVPILEFHGDNDTTIPYTGGQGKGGTLPDIDDWLAWWAKWNECPAEGKTVTSAYDGGVQLTSWNCGKGEDGLVQGYKVHGLGHDWPSLKPNLDNDGGTVVEATSVIMEWFKRWSLPEKSGWIDA